MTSFQVGLLILFVIAVAVCWVWGGDIERRAAAWVLIVHVIEGGLPPTAAFKGVLPVEVGLDAVLTLIMLRLAMTGNRWWPFAAAGSLLLLLVLHMSVLLDSGIGARAYISAQIGLAALLFLNLLAGTLERVLAGEPASSPAARWRRSKAA